MDIFTYFDGLTVASFAEAWIETLSRKQRNGARKVASFAEAWIETRPPYKLADLGVVASFAEAWIETAA